MAMAISNVLQCSNYHFSQRKPLASRDPSLPLFVRYSRTIPRKSMVVCMASSAAGSSNPDNDVNPYEVLGVSSIEGFDMIKAAYTRKRKDAERRGDEATADLLEKAYDKVMMSQLTNRKKGLTFGSFKVSKDIKYADKQPIVPWGPRFTKSSVQDTRINMAISAFFTAWILITRNAEWKPLQFLAFVFVYRVFEKLKSSEPPVSPTFTEDGEDEGRALRMGKRLLRSLALVFGCIAVSALGFTGVLNLIELLGQYIPASLYNNQELVVTAATAVMLFIMASYYR
ncbi:uncharacterized protein LOC122666271 [Telopea speciosissima]|uniref:uncharacterized protein LOC122666271 n=1 Tax=Telopea speciosissima TaxID=54955 RepID=UPI001CC788A0|nr:uncharacterized protein LOC122666271 [Telopea speciosissima]